MPLSFVVLGIIVLYIMVFDKQSISKMLYILSLLAITISFVTENIVITDILGINILSIVGVTLLIIVSLSKANITKVMIISMLACVMYSLMVSYNIDNLYIFSSTPLVIIMIIMGLYLHSVYDIILYGAISVVLINCSSAVVCTSNGWYCSLVDIRLISTTILVGVLLIAVRILIMLVAHIMHKNIVRNTAN